MMTPTTLSDSFVHGLSDHWKRCQIGDARLELKDQVLRLVNQDTVSSRYSNAQIDDYRGLPRRDFLWSPPLRLTVRARFSHAGPALAGGCDYVYHATPDGGPILSGTAGFGFWNDPFLMTERRLPTLPRALWFFYGSPPSNMRLDLDTPGCGWKAATIDAVSWPFVLLAPTAPLALPLMHVSQLYDRLWPVAQRAMRVSEALVSADMTAWHTYVIDWESRYARFLVDDRLILECATPPKGPLGLVIWLDNQFMVVTPQGRVRHGLLAQPGRQWLELDLVRCEAASVERSKLGTLER